jgi:hypothetical protein
MKDFVTLLQSPSFFNGFVIAKICNILCLFCILDPISFVLLTPQTDCLDCQILENHNKAYYFLK